MKKLNSTENAVKLSSRVVFYNDLRKSLKIKKNALLDFANAKNYSVEKQQKLAFCQTELTINENLPKSTSEMILQFDYKSKKANSDEFDYQKVIYCSIKSSECHTLVLRSVIDLIQTNDEKINSLLSTKSDYKKSKKDYIFKLSHDDTKILLQAILDSVNKK